MKKIAVLSMVIVLSFMSSCKDSELPVIIKSPNEKVEVMFSLDESGMPYYLVSYGEKILIAKSHLSLTFTNGELEKDLKVTHCEATSHDETYDLVVGKSARARNHYYECCISLQEKASLKRKLKIVFRAYDDGVAFRYQIPRQKTLSNFEITSERSEFRLLENGKCWALTLENFATNYEDVYHNISVADIEPDSYIGLPLTIESETGPWLAITEANLTDYAGMYLDKDTNNKLALISKLSPLPDSSGICVKGNTPHQTPWRVIMIGDKPGDLIESNLVLNLNESCAIADPSWIKPGKAAWPWWSGRVVKGAGFESGMNTETMKHYIDFAADYGLEYLLVDAKWYGPHKDSVQDITTTIPEIDMPHIIQYANDKQVDVVVWVNWQNTRDQMDVAFPLYEQWGIKGIKIDYMNRDDQEMVRFYHDVIKKAALHHLLVDFHGAYKPTGIRRTYPNFITREGVLGLEHTKWSTNVTPEHNVILPFTRMLAGPMDYTPGAFHNVTEPRFTAQYDAPMAMGTRCHHLAMFVVYESPFQMVSDYPGAYREQVAAEFLRIVPASWDETRVITGEIGSYIAIARRSGNDWFIGAMTDWTPRSMKLSLAFLAVGNKYDAMIYADSDDTAINPTKVLTTKTKVTASDSLNMSLSSGGGYVVHLKPVKH